MFLLGSVVMGTLVVSVFGSGVEAGPAACCADLPTTPASFIFNSETNSI